MRHAVDAPRPDHRDGHPRPGGRQPRRHACCSSPTAASSTRMAAPTADRVLDRMKAVPGADAVITTIAHKHLEPQAPAARDVRRRGARRRLPHRRRLIFGDTAKAGFRNACSSTPTPAPTSSCAAPAASARPRTASGGLLDASTGRRRARRSTAWPTPRRTSRARPSSSAPTATPLGGDGPPTTGGQLDRRPGAERATTSSRAGRRRRAPDEVVIDRGHAPDGDLHVGDHDRRADARSGRP